MRMHAEKTLGAVAQGTRCPTWPGRVLAGSASSQSRTPQRPRARPSRDGPKINTLYRIGSGRWRRASLSAAASCGRRSSASEPLPVSISTKTRASEKPSASAKRSSACFCTSSPRPERPCCDVDPRTFFHCRSKLCFSLVSFRHRARPKIIYPSYHLPNFQCPIALGSNIIVRHLYARVPSSQVGSREARPSSVRNI